MKKFNIRDFDAKAFNKCGEVFETIASSANSTLKVERILSRGDVSEDGFWYEQDKDEFVMLVSGCARIQTGDSEIELKDGDCLLIPKMFRHRVSYTSSNPPCVWLAVFGDFESAFSPKQGRVAIQ